MIASVCPDTQVMDELVLTRMSAKRCHVKMVAPAQTRPPLVALQLLSKAVHVLPGGAVKIVPLISTNATIIHVCTAGFVQIRMMMRPLR